MEQSNKERRDYRRYIRGMNKIHAKKLSENVAHELTVRPDLIIALGYKILEFIIWAGNERTMFDANIDEEVIDFLAGRLGEQVRLSVSNANAWLKLRKKVFKRDNYTCVYCRATDLKLECDHVIPFSKGGSDDIYNLATSCFLCNRIKRDKSLQEFKQIADAQ